ARRRRLVNKGSVSENTNVAVSDGENPCVARDLERSDRKPRTSSNPAPPRSAALLAAPSWSSAMNATQRAHSSLEKKLPRADLTADWAATQASTRLAPSCS